MPTKSEKKLTVDHAYIILLQELFEIGYRKYHDCDIALVYAIVNSYKRKIRRPDLLNELKGYRHISESRGAVANCAE